MSARGAAVTVNGGRLRIGIVGCGHAAWHHVRALAGMPEWQVAALADPDVASRDRLAAVARPERVADRHDDLVADPTLDAIAVCVPAQSHASVAIDAIDAGKHVYVEKPLALTLDDCRRLVERARSAGVCATTGFNLRWHAHARRAREAIRRRELGPIEMIASRMTTFNAATPDWRRSRSSGGGVLFELASHHVDLWCWLTGASIDEVFAFTRSGEWDDQSACLVARMSDGTLASAAFGERTSRSHEVDIFGVAGSVSMSLYRFDGYRKDEAATVAGESGSRLRAALAFARALPGAVVGLRDGGAWAASYRNAWRHFAAAIRGETALDATLDDGARAVAVVLAAQASARSGRGEKPVEA